jgi:HK97 family phage portal protein
MRSLIGSIVDKSPVPLTPTRRGGVSGLFRFGSGQERLLGATTAVGTIFMIVNRTSTATSAVEWKLWKKAASGKEEDRVEVTRHAALDLWNKPNPFMPRQEFVETAQQHIDLIGESCIAVGHMKLNGQGVPIELWPVRPDRIKPNTDPYTFLDGYTYTSPDGDKIPMSLTELLQIKMPNPLDPYRGLGPVQSILTDIDSTKYSAEWNRAFFENSAQPGGTIEVPESLSDPEFNRMKDQWSAGHKGVNNAHRVAILERGAKWNGNSFTQKDMQFAELRGVSRDVMMEAFGFPKPMAGIVEDVNRANAEAAEYFFAKYLTVPRLERWKGFLNHDLLPQFGNTTKDLEFDYESPVDEDVDRRNDTWKAQAEFVAKMVAAGADPGEACVAVGLPIMAWRDMTQPAPIPTGRDA